MIGNNFFENCEIIDYHEYNRSKSKVSVIGDLKQVNTRTTYYDLILFYVI